MYYKVAAAAVARRVTPKGVLKAGGGHYAGASLHQALHETLKY